MKIRRIQSYHIFILLLSVVGTTCIWLTSSEELLLTWAGLNHGRNTPPIAKIESMSGTVLSKSQRMYLWIKPKEGADLYQRDSIFTYEVSSAAVVFEKVSVFLEEFSFIEISTAEDGTPIVKLNSGSLDLLFKEDGSIFVQLEKEKKLLEAKKDTKVSVSQLDNGEIEITPEKGELEIDKKRSLKPGEQAKLDDNGKAQVNKISSQLISPPDSAVLKKSKIEPVTFSWKKTTSLQETFILSLDEKFESPLKKVDTNSDSIIFSPSGIGTYFWKVEVNHKENTYSSDIFYFRIESTEVPSPLTPKFNQSVLIDASQPLLVDSPNSPGTETETADLTKFSWQDTNAKEEFQLQVAKDSSFNEAVVDRAVKDQSIALDIKQGAYFWRVRRATEDSLWSQAMPFSVIRKTVLNPEALKMTELPTPIDKTIFLTTRKLTLPVWPKVSCANKCTLKLDSPTLNLSQTFEAGEAPQMKVVFTGEKEDVRWTLEDGGETLAGSFSIDHWNKINLTKAVSTGNPITVEN